MTKYAGTHFNFNLICMCACSFMNKQTSSVDASSNLEILHMNDHHSYIDPKSFDLFGEDIPSALNPSTISKISINYGGMPLMKALIDSIEEDNANGNFLKLHCGDAIVGTPFFTLFNGEVDAHMMSHICFDAFAIGNHEFDYGDRLLANFLRELNSHTECPKTPVVAANIVPGEFSPLMSLFDDGTITSSITKTLPDGKTVGIIGIDIKAKTMNASSPDPGTTVTDEKKAAQDEISKLKAVGVQVIILMTHIGIQNDMDWMVDLEDVDIVLGADSHTLMGDSEDYGLQLVTGGKEIFYDYPMLFNNKNGRKVCLAHAWSYTHGVGRLSVTLDDDGDVLTCNGNMVFPFNGNNMTASTHKGEEYELSPEEAASVVASLESLGPHLVAVEKDAAADSTFLIYESQVKERFDTAVATVPVNICYDRVPGQGRSSFCSAEETAEHGGGVCDLVAKAFLHTLKPADLVILNAGGCRTDIAAGDFTIRDAFTLLPFSNWFVELQMTGDDIIMVLESALALSLDPNGSTGAYPCASGIRYDVDASKPPNKRLSNIEVNSRNENDWEPIDPAKTYAVGTISYLAGGKDGYSRFKDILDELLVIEDKTKQYAQAFVDYAENVGILLEPPVEERSTQSFIPIQTSLGTSNSKDSNSGDASKLATSILGVLIMIMITCLV